MPAEPASAAVAREFVRGIGRELALEQRDIDDLTLATSEAITNAIEHGRSCKARGVRLSVQDRLDRVIVEVCDCGALEVPLPTTPPALPDPEAIRGRGLPIIEALADELELLPDGEATLVRFSKRRRKMG
ncbi:MAG TPA: ATP-binding protein [Thermoleophilaceae bacterium]|nr:ATP-binding protein [Thermoleophilaceae bacterium]